MKIENFDKVKNLVAARSSAIAVLERLDQVIDEAGQIETEYWASTKNINVIKFLITRDMWTSTFRAQHVANIAAIEQDLRALGVSMDPLPPDASAIAEAAE